MLQVSWCYCCCVIIIVERLVRFHAILQPVDVNFRFTADTGSYVLNDDYVLGVS